MAVNLSAQGSRLGLARPAVTTIVTLFTASIQTEITRIVVCHANPGGAAHTFSLYHAPNGIAFGQDNVLYAGFSINPGQTVDLIAGAPNAGIHMDIGDTFGIQTSAASELTFHVYGVTASIAPGTY